VSQQNQGIDLEKVSGMKVELPILNDAADINANIEMALWCLLALRANMKGPFRGFDDSILSLCIDIIFREMHLQAGHTDSNLHRKLDELLIKYSSASNQSA
jgi:hypothetical protein